VPTQPGPTVAACQCEVDDLDPDSNVRRVDRRLAGLPDRTDVAVFPEHALTGFVADERVEEVALSSETVADRLGSLAAEHDLAILAGYVERGAGDRLHNAAALVRPDGESVVYRKRHLWGDEGDWLTPGEDRVVVETALGRTGLLTCYDLNFVEESAAFTRERVDALLVVGAWPAPHGDNWRLLCRARALDGLRWVVGTDRVGTSGETVYAGRSLVVRPNGSVHSALDIAPGDLVADIDPEELARHRGTVGIFGD
jgi:predicted amidohydrolase